MHVQLTFPGLLLTLHLGEEEVGMRRIAIVLGIVVALTLLACMATQDIHGARGGAVINRKFLMAFQACDVGGSYGCRESEEGNVYLAQSNDGVHWLPMPGIQPFQGNVPDLIRRDNSLYVYYLTFGSAQWSETLNVRRYNVRTAALEAEDMVMITDDYGIAERIVDPSLIVDDDGKLVLFYLVQDVGMNDPARCMPGSPTCNKVFRSATEVEGSDGTEFIVDAGNRYERQIGPDEIIVDPDVFRTPDGYVMYVGYADERYQAGPPDAALALFSTDLRGSYALIPALEDGVLTRSISGGAGMYDFATKQYWTYGAQVDPRGSLVIAGAAHAGFDTTILESRLQIVVTGQDVMGLGPDFGLASPGLALNLP